MHFFEGVHVRRTHFRWPYKPIRELFEFFSKYKNINFSCLTNSEIFSEFKEPFFVLILLLLRR